MTERGCLVAKILLQINDEDKTALRNLLDSEIAAVKISIILNKNGHRVSQNTVWKHRTGRCSCIGVE